MYIVHVYTVIGTLTPCTSTLEANAVTGNCCEAVLTFTDKVSVKSSFDVYYKHAAEPNVQQLFTEQ